MRLDFTSTYMYVCQANNVNEFNMQVRR